jgi:glyoxylase-like metal-dependent hydrolase (beta-lactamase superfamily II)
MRYQIFPVTSYQQNCSLVWCESTGSAALVDPGGEAERLLEEVARRGLSLEKILLTHGHIDHVGAAKEIAEFMNIPIIGPHMEDAFWLETLPQQAQMFGFLQLESFVPNQWLEDGDVVEVGEIELKVIHCPGHTPGHIVFYHAQSNTAFVGDVLFQGSIGRTDFPRGDYDTLISSIKNKLLLLGDEITFIPGHGPISTFGQERQTNPFLIDS